MAEARRRLAPEARRELLVDAAEQVFAETGYTRSGLAEIAAVADVSKTLLYHYFPDGRPELYRAVIERGTEQLLAAMDASGLASTPAERITRLVDALLAHFDAHPAAYRLIIAEPWGSGDPDVVGRAAAVRMRLAAAVVGALGSLDQPVSAVTAGAAAAIGTVLAVCELQAMGTLEPSDASALATGFVLAGLAGVQLL